LSLSLPTQILPQTVPARMVNEFVYCPRLAYPEWVQGDWADNADTAEGRFTHRAVDRPSGALPPPDQPEEAQIEKLHARSVWLSAEEEGLTTRIDLHRGRGGYRHAGGLQARQRP